ncbi:3-hydroxyacyl-CoA dehydrogenase NAD-binding domain-containing protein [Hydrocarboniphaga sp.]|uniref:3-hydroxyacyl-CoA dehydrogenase NAD-binding domain-containing protein n=1 Tax=Hydrocarboniphaga sp. TaxID=2033016 RepID=UPI003D11113B
MSHDLNNASAGPMVRSDIQDGIATLTIDMPGRSMNVIAPELAAELRQRFDAAIADASVSGIIIASGKSSFIAGADLSQMAAFAEPGLTPQQAAIKIGYLSELYRHIETAGKPVVAAASGTALGGGLELMLCCHYRIAADNPGAQFGTPEVKLGLLPGAGGTQRLPRLIGVVASLPLLTQGTSLSPTAALKAGLLNEVVPAPELLAAARRALLEGRVKAIAPWDEKGYRIPGGDAYAPAVAAALTAANASLHAATREHTPAPLAILRCLYEGLRLPIAKGLKLEIQHFVTLVQGRVAQNLIRTMFFAKQSADKLARRPKQVPATTVRKLGILGAGFMGAGVAQVSAQAGIDVVLLDRDLVTAQRGRDGIVKALESDVAKGRLAADKKDQILSRISAAEGYEAFADCDLVIEAVVEDAGVKALVTRAAEAAMRGDAIFASNTSALPIGDLAAVSTRPGQFIGLHFFSPVPRMALVEVIVGRATSDETLARALDYIKQIRRTPIVVNDGPGFYTTRCVDAYLREGMRLLADGVDPVLLENAAVALGMPVGPLALADEVGIDVAHHIAHFLRGRESGACADDRHASNAVLDRQVALQHCGRKSGRGFYRYPQDEPKHLDPTLRESLRAEQPSSAQVQERLLLAQVLEAARCWAEGITPDASDADLGAILGWAFPAYLGGPMSVIDDRGAAAFVARCDELRASLGARFEVPARLRDFAASGARFHPVRS